MKIQEAIKTMEAAGFTFLKRDRDEYTNQMDYYFRSPMGNVQVYGMGGLRVRADREQWVAWSRAQVAKLERGIQLELF